MSNLETGFEMKFTRMTMFKALNNKSMTTGWLNAFLKEAVNLRSLAIDCQYVQDENVVLMGNLSELRDLVLRDCLHVTDFSPLSSLAGLRSIVIDFGEKGTEDQLWRVVRGSKNWRRIIFNELVDTVSNRFLVSCANHFRFHSCPLAEFEMNTEKTKFKWVDHAWGLPEVDGRGVEAVAEACPLLEVLGVCSNNIDDRCLLKVAEWCPRIQSVVVNESNVTNEGVLAFYDALRRKRVDAFLGVGTGGALVNARNTLCTSSLVEEARDRFGKELKVVL